MALSPPSLFQVIPLLLIPLLNGTEIRKINAKSESLLQYFMI